MDMDSVLSTQYDWSSLKKATVTSESPFFLNYMAQNCTSKESSIFIKLYSSFFYL